MTIRNFLDNAAEHYADRPAQRFHRGGKWVTRPYHELKDRVIRIAAVLRDLSLRPGHDNVAIMLPNCPEWEEIYLALSGVGITAVPMDARLKAREVLHILRDSQARAIFAGNAFAELVDSLIGDLPDLKTCIFVGSPDILPESRRGCEVKSFEALVEASPLNDSARAWYEGHKPTDDSVASILYTSGTTGAPKGAMLTHRNFEANADFAKNVVPFGSDDDFLVVLPLFHAYAFMFGFLTPVYVGGCSSFVRSLKTISEDMRILRPTTILAVPLLAEKMYAKIAAGIKANPIARFLMAVGLSKVVGKKVSAVFGGRLKVMAIGGAPTDKNVLRAFQKLGVPAIEGYGLTECGPLVSFSPAGQYVIGTVGRVLPCMEYKVVNEDATGAGELRVKGPNVMKGYYHNEKATADAFDGEGYLKTGDIVRVDWEGNVAICGRGKAMIVNREGKNIYPEEIENVVGRCPLVAASIAIGYRIQGETGEHVGLIVQPDEDACKAAGADNEAVKAAVQKLCGEQLAEYKVPRKVLVRAEPFEMTSTMKVKRVTYEGTLDE
ncbi:MAG: AMP-binding protein [Kiritimatiellae bacterium]|nr:AMP-binding protein [Kiritimatiellia bacterium]